MRVVTLWSRLISQAPQALFGELRTIMAKVPDPSRPIRCPFIASESEAKTEAAALAPMWAEVGDQDIGPCVQDVDPSHGTTASHIGDCNLECCHCAIRWYARRIINRRDN